MKRFPEFARRAAAMVLAASMSLSVLAPGAYAVSDTSGHVHLAAENSVDELGNEDLSDEVFDVPDDTAAKPVVTETSEEPEDDTDAGLSDDLTEEQLAEQAAVDAAGHEEHTPDTDAEPVYEEPSTCTEAGYAIYPCSFTLEQEDGTTAHCYHQVVVSLPLADHQWGDWQTPEDADSQNYRVCEVCGAVEYADGTIVTPGGITITDPDHPEWLPGDIGIGGNYDDQIETLWGHTHDFGCPAGQRLPYNTTVGQFGSWIKRPTCTSYGKVRKQCASCLATAERETEKAPHSYGGWIEQKASCTAAGKKYRVCSVCGHEDVDTSYATANPQLPHSWGEWVETKATCTTAGSRTRTCSTCGKVEPDEDYAAKNPATGHKNAAGDKWYDNDPDTAEVGWVVDKAATCGVAGSKSRTCVTCGEKETQTIPATGNHTAGEKTTVTEAKCGVKGKWEIRCTVCNALMDSGEIPALEHNWEFVSTTQKYPCQPGKETWQCTLCNKTEERDAKVVDHKLGEWEVTVQPTCEKNGTRVQKCTVCGEIIKTDSTEGDEIKALDHAWDEGTIDQKYPCVDGTITYKCTRKGCTKTKTETYKAVAEHSYGAWYDDYEYGCTTQNESRVCLICGHKETRDSGNPVRKHKYTNYVMSTPNRWTTVKIPVSLDSWVVNILKALGVNFDDSGKNIVITDEMPTPIVRADCDFGCGAYDEINAVNYPEFAAQAWAATEASKSVANTAAPLIKEALADTKTAVNNAQNREEAIASLDQIYNVAKQKLLDQGSVKVDVDLKITGKWPENLQKYLGEGWTVPLYSGTITVPITEEIVDGALGQLKAAIDDAKNMLSNSFLSEDAVKVGINKIVDTVAGDSGLTESIRQLSFYPIYKSLNKRGDNWPNQATDATQTETAQLILRLADSLVKKDPNAETDAWQEFLDAIFDDLVDMLIEQLKKDEDYSKYLNNKLGDELLQELRPKLREELVNDTTFVDTIRGIASNAIENAANGVNKGWSDERVLANLREDLLKVQDPVEEEMNYLATRIGDLVSDSLTQKINNFLPFGDLTSWIGKWVGGFAKDLVVKEVSGETGKVRSTIDLYVKYITCGSHDQPLPQRIARNASCTETEVTETYCPKCGWVFKKEDTAPALGHVPVNVAGVAATETTDGLTDGVQCARCGTWIEPQEVIPALTPEYDKWYVKANITADTVKATGYKSQQKLDETIDNALKKAGFEPANSERFLAQVQTNLDVLKDEYDREPGEGASRILTNDRYPEMGVTAMVRFPAKAPGKDGTYYAVQILTADNHGYSAGDVVVTPLTVTEEGISFKTGVQAVVAIAWKPNN